jgi:hypothetical protein
LAIFDETDPAPGVQQDRVTTASAALTGRTERIGYWMLRMQIPPTG